MGIIRSVDSKGHYFSNVGPHSKKHPHKYYFNPHNEKSIMLAYDKAKKQQTAIFQSGYKISKKKAKK